MSTQHRTSGWTWQSRSVALLAGGAFVLVAACGGGAKPTGRADASPTVEPTAPPESAQVVQVARTHAPTYVAGSGSGTLMMVYEAADGCYLRKVDRDGNLSSGKAPTCGAVHGTRTGFVMVDPMDPTVVYDVTYPWDWKKSDADLEKRREPAEGDAFLAACSWLVDVELAQLDQELLEAGCAWDESSDTMYAVPDMVAIDAKGHAWLDGDGSSVVRADAEDSDSPAQLPARIGGVMVDAGSTMVAWSADFATDVFITTDAAQTWQPVTEDTVPELARLPDKIAVLGDQVLMGPHNGRIWRTDDPDTGLLSAHPAGPLTRLYAAGTLLWATAAESSDPALARTLWVSDDLGDTWAQVLDGADAAPATAVPASSLAGSRSDQVEALIKNLDPVDMAVDGNGDMLVLYQNRSGTKVAWQLLDQHDKTVASGMGGYGATAAEEGFIVAMDDGNVYLDGSGTLTPVEVGERQAPQKGDVFVQDDGVVFRATGPTLFQAVAEPDGVVTGQTSDGVMWAVARKTGGRTVVRWASPGGPWQSRDLGASIGARQVYAGGTVVLVPGRSQVYASSDSGKTWWLATHHAANYSGGPGFVILPDGSAIGGDYRGGVSESRDLRTWSAPTYGGSDWVPTIGSLFARDRSGPGQDISVDRVHWVTFSPKAARELLAEQSAMRVHG